MFYVFLTFYFLTFMFTLYFLMGVIHLISVSCLLYICLFQQWSLGFALTIHYIFCPFLTTGITFTPRETGPHIVNVFRNGAHIPNSPFTITVGESELGNASKVKVYGKGLEEGMANEVNEFVVDTTQAGQFHICHCVVC